MKVSDRWPDIGTRLPGDIAPTMVAALRAHVPAIVREAVAEIERAVPQYARPGYARVLQRSAALAIGHFVDLLADHAPPSDPVLDHFRAIGAGEAREGRGLEEVRAALRTGAGVAMRRLTEACERVGHPVTAVLIAEVSQAMLLYLGRLTAAAAEGHTEVAARAADERENRRRALLDLLIREPPPRRAELREPMRRAKWLPPRTVAAVALRARHPDARLPPFPEEILSGTHLDEPCLIVPDPDAPDRRRKLRTALRGWMAVLGPTVTPTELGRSLRWARQTLDLAAAGLIEHDGLVAAEEHIPLLLMSQDRDLLERAASRRLRPLMRLRPAQGRRLAETFLISLECGFDVEESARRLRVHPQTVRYRIRQLEAFFGAEVHAADKRLEFHMLLFAWLAMNRAPEGPPDAGNGVTPGSGDA